MKLKNRLIVTFLFIVFVPIILMSGAFFGIREYMDNAIEKSYGIQSDGYDITDGSASMLSGFSSEIYEQLQEIAEDNPEKFEDEDYLEKINGELSSRYSYLIVRRGDELVYVGTDNLSDEIERSLPEYDGETRHSDMGVYVGGNIPSLIKQVDFTYSNGDEGSILVVTQIKTILPELKAFLIDLIVSMILILVFTSIALTLWTYKGIVTPIRRLQVAAQKIKDGDLNFSIEAETNDEIGLLCDDFEEMRKRLKESAEEKIVHDKDNKELISNISHDLKTPITSIKGYVEGIMDGVADTPQKQERYLKTIYTKANEMDSLINELTLYSKIDTNRVPYNFQIIPLADFFNDCVEDIGLDLEEQNIGLSYDNFCSEDTRIIADVEQLKRVVGNIISNSRKYIDKKNGFIRITLKDVGNCVQVEIEDNGKGISKQDLPYVFDRFFRTDESRNSLTGGSGIGLSIVKKIVEDHGGKIWVTSQVGQGTCMFIILRKYEESESYE